MDIRDFVKRHRIASAVAAPAALGVAVAVAATFALTSSPGEKRADPALTSSVTECHDMVTISVAGRNDSPQSGTTKMLVDANGNELPAALSDDYQSHWVDPVVNAPNGSVDSNSYSAVYISYPANLDSYENAVDTGVANTEQVMRDISAACPNTKFAIVGYSEGADVARRVAMQIGHQTAGADGKYGIVDPGNVAGVVILADSGRTAGDGPFPGAKDPYSHPDNFGQSYQSGKEIAGGQGALQGNAGDFGSLNGRIASFCSDGDLTCAAPKNISLLQLAINVGRQINADQMQSDGLTPTTGMDVAVVLGKIAGDAFADIAHNPGWWTSKETFLDVLLKVSDPNYKPNQDNPTPVAADSIQAENMAPLAYLPQKVFNEVIGLITTNQNTIPVLLNDPYNLTLGPNGTGHHFDYWRDSNPDNGKPLTSAEYAAAWLTELAKEAQAGQLNPKTLTATSTTTSAPAVLAAAPKTATSGSTTPATGSTTPTVTTTPAAPVTTTPAATTPPTTTVTPDTTTAPVTTTTSPTTTTTVPTTTPLVTTTTPTVTTTPSH
ncbi:cutinase family protein [Nocardia aurantiaca]|uniref:Cutinase family protein n=1 Tax=Nocardia aurantiaca TaxID=2675850 RepID=A0A6I3L3N3_9NOCA|nr:cutinase family protein [Nocardia aurantiaca]MTE15520.1 cutinase family protein [Nocardia aurantiaca]